MLKVGTFERMTALFMGKKRHQPGRHLHDYFTPRVRAYLRGRASLLRRVIGALETCQRRRAGVGKARANGKMGWMLRTDALLCTVCKCGDPAPLPYSSRKEDDMNIKKNRAKRNYEIVAGADVAKDKIDVSINGEKPFIIGKHRRGGHRQTHQAAQRGQSRTGRLGAKPADTNWN